MTKRWAPLLVVLLLGSCGPGSCSKQDTVADAPKVYASLAECQADLDEKGDRRHTDEDCSKAFAGAKEDHAKQAPRFAEQGSCEEKYGPGNCVPRREGDHDVFLPLMAGFMLGHALGGGGSQTTIISRPVYIDRGGAAYTGTQRIGSYSSGTWSTTNTAAIRDAPSSSTSTIGRGGFGQGASSVTMPSAPSAPTAATVPGSVSRGGFGATAATTSASSGE